MDIDARIERRQRRDDSVRLVKEYELLSPVAHVEEPSDRGPVLEELLNHLDPVFDGRLPPNAYVHGPSGVGKSAVVSALIAHLRRRSPDTQSVIHTSTRTASPTLPQFVYVDRRTTASEFAFYHRVLDGLVDERVPDHGISTAEIRSRLQERLDTSRTGVVVAVDHVDEPAPIATDSLVELFAGLASNVSWVAIGRTAPEQIAMTDETTTVIPVGRYRRETLVDLLMSRASEGLARHALDHDLARRIAEWANGNAHDALAVLFVAADSATRADRSRITTADVDAAIDEMPDESVSLSRVLALPANKRAVLRELVDLDVADRASVTETTEAIRSRGAVDLSPGTVKRFLYEMAEIGVVERVQAESPHDKGRPPSRVELRFPPTAFRRLSAPES